jgi:hypothetical protein
MRMLTAVVIAGAFACGGYLSAQDTPASSRPIYTPEAMMRRIAGPRVAGHNPVTCVAPDATERSVGMTLTAGGRVFRCVQVLDETLKPLGVAWTPVPLEP